MGMDISTCVSSWSYVTLVYSNCISFLLLTEYFSTAMAYEGGSSALVLTPGGYRHVSNVRRLHHAEGVSPEYSATTKVTFHSLPVDALESGWIQDASFSPPNTSAIYYFSTVWTVPPFPASTQAEQTIFLFNSLMPPARNTILQPVLQWGPSAAGGGKSWYVTSWYVNQTTAIHQDLFPVNVGDTLKGVLILTGQSGINFNYVSFFEGIPWTLLQISNISQLTVATQTLECYDIKKCSNYPNTSDTSFSSIDLKMKGTSLAANGSSLNAYQGNDSSQHVNYIDGIGHVHELYLDPYVRAWVNHDLIGFSGGAPAASDSGLAGYWGSDKSQHVLYIDKNNHLHELYIGRELQWTNNDLTAFARGTSAAPGSSISGYWGGDDSQHVNFFDIKGHVHELYSSHPGAQWVDNDLTALTQGIPARFGSGLVAYQGSDKIQHVNFIDTDGHIHDLFINPGDDPAWKDNDLTKSTEGATAASDSYLSAHWAKDNSQHISFIDANNNIHKLSTHPGAPWTDENLSLLANSSAKARNSSPLNANWGASNSLHVNYIDEASHVHEMYLQPGGQWVDNDITVSCNGRCPLVAQGTGLNSYWASTNSQHVNFVSVDLHVYELSIQEDQHLAGSFWSAIDLAVAGGINFRTVNWTADSVSSKCGEKTVIVSDENPGGQVDIFYRPG